MSIFTGACTALITPFDENGVNTAEFARFIRFQLEGDINALLVCGTTGEPSTMTKREKCAALECALDTVAKRVPVIMGVGGNNTAKVIAEAQNAQKLGADALLAVTPYYNKCTQAGLAAHFGALAESVSLPIIIYNVPGRTGLNMLPETYVKLAGHSNITGVKEASGNMLQINEIMRIAPNLDVYSGDDGLAVPVMAMGGKGVISVLSDIVPKYVSDMCALALCGETARAAKMQLDALPLISALFCEVNPIPAKTAARLMGFNTGNLRLPLTPMAESSEQRLIAEMRAFKLI